MDLRAVCRFCGRRWLPPAGMSAGVHYCPACSAERVKEAQIAALRDDKVELRRDSYVVRVPRKISA